MTNTNNANTSRSISEQEFSIAAGKKATEIIKKHITDGYGTKFDAAVLFYHILKGKEFTSSLSDKEVIQKLMSCSLNKIKIVDAYAMTIAREELGLSYEYGSKMSEEEKKELDLKILKDAAVQALYMSSLNLQQVLEFKEEIGAGTLAFSALHINSLLDLGEFERVKKLLEQEDLFSRDTKAQNFFNSQTVFYVVTNYQVKKNQLQFLLSNEHFQKTFCETIKEYSTAQDREPCRELKRLVEYVTTREATKIGGDLNIKNVYETILEIAGIPGIATKLSSELELKQMSLNLIAHYVDMLCMIYGDYNGVIKLDSLSPAKNTILHSFNKHWLNLEFLEELKMCWHPYYHSNRAEFLDDLSSSIAVIQERGILERGIDAIASSDSMDTAKNFINNRKI